MRIITGDECGLLKETIPEIGRSIATDDYGPTNVNNMPITVDKGIRRIPTDDISKQSRSRGIIDMSWIPGEDDNKFSILRKDSTIEIYTSNIMEEENNKSRTENKHFEYEVVECIENIFQESTNDDRELIGMGYTSMSNKLCAADSFGNISIVNPTKGSVVANYYAYSSNKNKNSKISYTKGAQENRQQATTMIVSEEKIAIGGREREITLLDLNNGTSTWKAKNLPPDPQTLLQQPVWPTALCFLSDNILISGTAYQQMRLYDIRTQRRPLSTSPDGLFEHRIMSICPLNHGANLLAVGDTTGNLLELDIRMQMTANGKRKKTIPSLPRFVGPVGSIRKLVKHETEPILVAVGLDRMLRTYHIPTRKQLDCVYMKQRLNSALICKDKQWSIETTSDLVTTNEGEGDIRGEKYDIVNDYVDSSEEESDVQMLNICTKALTNEEEEATDPSRDDDDEDDDDDESNSQESNQSDYDDEDEEVSSSDDDESSSSQPQKKQRSR